MPPIAEPISSADLETFFHQLAAIKTLSTTLVTITSNVTMPSNATPGSPVPASPNYIIGSISTQWDSNTPAPATSPAIDDPKGMASHTKITASSNFDGDSVGDSERNSVTGPSLTALPNLAGAPQETDTQKGTDSHASNSGFNKARTGSANSAQSFPSGDSQNSAGTISTAISTTNSESTDVNAAAKSTGTSLLSVAALREHAAAGPAISESLQAWNGGDNAQAVASHMAHLEKTSSSSEINIALQAETLGNVELKAHITGDQIGATITVDRHDVHAALVSDLPSLHQGLGEKQMRMDNVTVQQSSPNTGQSAGSADDTGAQRQQRNTNPERHPAANWSGDSPAQESAAYGAGMVDSSVIFDSKGRLSVRA